MAMQLGSAEYLILAWLLAGILTLFGALSNAEVGAMLPVTGGQYVFFQRMYGEFVAYLYGWSAFIIFNSAGIASMAYVLGTYAEFFVDLPRLPPEVEKHLLSFTIPYIGNIYPFDNIGVKAVTVLVVLVLTLINYFSTRWGGQVQVVFTFLKFAAILFILFGFAFSGKGSVNNLFSSDAQLMPHGIQLVGAFAVALSGAFWGYDGWNNLIFVAGEIKDPQRNIPRSLFFGISICIIVYILITASYLYILPVSSIAHSSMVASDAAAIAFGTLGAGMIAAMVLISTFGAANASVLSNARVVYAMAEDGKFFSWAGKVHPRYDTPGNALVLQGFWASLLVISGSFDMLTDMLIFVSWLFYGLSALGVFVLRRKMAHIPRPYKVWGYPWVPGIFVLFTFAFLIITLWNDIHLYSIGERPVVNSLLGLALMLSGLPLYLWYRRKQNNAPIQ